MKPPCPQKQVPQIKQDTNYTCDTDAISHRVGASPLAQHGEVPPDVVRVCPFPSLFTKGPPVSMGWQLEVIPTRWIILEMVLLDVQCVRHLMWEIWPSYPGTSMRCATTYRYTCTYTCTYTYTSCIQHEKRRHVLLRVFHGPGNYWSAVTKSFGDCCLSRHVTSRSSHGCLASGQPKGFVLWKCVKGPCRGNKGESTTPAPGDKRQVCCAFPEVYHLKVPEDMPEAMHE